VDLEFWAAAAILGALYAAVLARQLLGRSDLVPYLFLAAAVALVAVGAISPTGAAQAVNLPILAFLFSMFVFAVALDRAGAMSHFARWLAAKASRPEDLVLLLFVGFGLASTIVLNDAFVVLMVPLLLHLSKRLGTPPLPLLLTLAYSVTVGSALTPMGNPQNLLIALSSGISDPIVTFLRYLLLPILVCLVLGGLLLRHWLGPQMRRSSGEAPAPRIDPVPFLPRGDWTRRIRAYPVLVIFPVTMASLLVIDLGNAFALLPSVPIDVVVAAGAALLLLVQPARQQIVARVDWSTMLLFVGLFIVMGGEVSAGVVGSLTKFFPVPAAGAGGSASPSALGSILLSSAIGSQVFSNVPWVAISIPTLRGLGYTGGASVAWVALAAGSTLAGNLTLLGAASNLIIANQAERGGVRIHLREFMRYGVPLALTTLLVVWVCLWAGL
jgi:Na+/H+ antiporter NhaD/arsenite permease-like protein